MTHKCMDIHRNTACVHICWHTEQINCEAAVIGGCETNSDCTDNFHFWLCALGPAAGSRGGGGGGMSGCKTRQGEGVLLLRSWTLAGKPCPALTLSSWQ